jgi:hypothetical protein
MVGNDEEVNEEEEELKVFTEDKDTFLGVERVETYREHVNSTKIEIDHFQNLCRVLGKEKTLEVDTSITVQTMLGLLKYEIDTIEEHYINSYFLNGSDDEEEETYEEHSRLSYTWQNLQRIDEQLFYIRNIVDQRLEGSQIPEFFSFIPSKYSISGSQSIYKATDALFEEIFFKTVLPKDFTKEKEFEWLIPLTVFGSSYAIAPYMNIAFIPHVDSTRLRFWGILGHEIFHLKLDFMAKASEDFLLRKDSILPAFPRLTNLLPQMIPDFSLSKVQNFLKNLSLIATAIYDELEVEAKSASDQLGELLCDVAGTLIGGPSYYYAFLSHFGFLEVDDWANISHPPDFVRAYIISNVLEEMKYPRETVKEWFDVEDNRDYIDNFPFVKRYMRIIDYYQDEIIKCVKPYIFGDIFDYGKWENAITIYDEIEKLKDPINFEGDYTPLDLVNIGWLKRENKFKEIRKNDPENIRKTFLNITPQERKMFFTLVRLMSFKRGE